MDDYVTLVLLSSSVFFVALSAGLLFRYRRVSQMITESSDLGRDLWQALEQRMKKQDERILDMMGRLEVVQSRLMAAPVAFAPIPPAPSPPISHPPPAVTLSEEGPSGVTELRPVALRLESHPESQAELDDTQMAAMKLLSERARSTIEIKDSLKRSREHTARLMKSLFDRGLVVRDDSKKPFVYRLTDVGRRYLSAS